MSKPHIYRVNGKWYCNLRHDDGSGVAGFYRAALGMAFDRVARQTPPFMAGKDSADSNAVVKSDCL